MQDHPIEGLRRPASGVHPAVLAPPPSWRRALNWIAADGRLARLLISGGALFAMLGVGWKLGVGAIHDGGAADGVLVGGLVAFIVGFVILTATGGMEDFLKAEGKPLLAVSVVGSMIAFGVHADQGPNGTFTDRILIWAFVVFVVGLAELFVLLVVSSVLGRIDLSRAFFEKGTEDGASPARRKSDVSLSRLQSFLWTLVVMIVYFHRVVQSVRTGGGLPTIPAELLMVMGISSAVYLTSKGMSQGAPAPAPSDAGGTARTPEKTKPDARGQPDPGGD